MAPRDISLIAYRSTPTQHAHFAIFIPSALNPDEGTIIHVVGAPIVGYQLEFKRNYSPGLTQRAHTRYQIGQIDSQYIVDATENTPSRDSTPKGAVELAASRVPPPAISQNFMAPVNNSTNRRCQEWTMDFVAHLVHLQYIDASAIQIVQSTGQRCLPTPSEVTARSTDFKNTSQPKPVKFEHLNLIVKFGPHVTVEEALCLRMIRRILPDKVPVPEVYGWKVEGGTVFIYMELIRGETLHGRWGSLSGSDRSSICNELHEIISSLRQIEQDPTDPFIGSITRRPLLDYVFESMPSGGPFKTIKEFNDWFSALPQHWVPESRKYQDLYQEFLPDTGAIKLTHGDLHRGNIMISSTSPPRVLAVVDWAHAGWYPDYWEYCKAMYTSDYNDEWASVWIPKFLSPYTVEYDIFAEYINQMGAV